MAARRKKKPETFTDAARAQSDQLLKDLEERAKLAGVDAALKAAWAAEKKAGRTGEAFPQWRQLRLAQVAAAWVLSCTFVRTLEDRSLVARARLVDATDGGAAKDSEEQFRVLFPFLGTADYLLAVFRELRRFPGLQGIFDPEHNPVWQLSPSEEGAQQLLAFFRDRGEDGALRWSFHGEVDDTRFLGDLYQDLNEMVRKRYALLQTPDFVEELILEETLDPAIERFGLEETKVLDPTCGSGHFLLGAFARLLDCRLRANPGADAKDLVQRALDQVYGCDINPYAVGIARFRLVLAATAAAGIDRLDAEDVPAWQVHLCVGNSLLVREGAKVAPLPYAEGSLVRRDEVLAFQFENSAEVDSVFGQRFAAVVGNPPYITEKDAVVRDLVRKRYDSAAGKYALAAPFTERFFQLAVEGGYVGMINSNAWCKREFGKALIEKVLPKYRLDMIVDASGAYIPGTGTPPLLLFGRRESPGSSVVTVQGKRGDQGVPEHPANGRVWSSIRDHRGDVGYEDEWVSVVSIDPDVFQKHPWSLGGGGAAELKEAIESTAERRLGDLSESIGVTSFTLEDDVFLIPKQAAPRLGIEPSRLRRMVEGESLRDWTNNEGLFSVFPYTDEFRPMEEAPCEGWWRYLWVARTRLSNSKLFGGKTKVEAGQRWYEFGRLTRSKLRTPLSITFAFFATHNHFVLDRGGRVFNRTAPVMKLPEGVSEEDHVEILGVLNSSLACFWMKQEFQNRGSTVDKKGARQRLDLFEDFFEFTGTGMLRFPLRIDGALTNLASLLDSVARKCRQDFGDMSLTDVETAAAAEREMRAKLVTLQEELDWQTYRVYGVLGEENEALPAITEAPRLKLGERAFEIALARRMAGGKERSGWFDRHHSEPITELPGHWPDSYKRVVEARIRLIEEDRNIGLLERPEYKRRWSVEPWSQRLAQARHKWLVERLESGSVWPRPGTPNVRPWTLDELADRVSDDAEFRAVVNTWRGTDDADLRSVVEELVLDEGVPAMASCRYKGSGFEKRTQWEHTWDLQRAEDRREFVAEVSMPPNYASKDFARSEYWKHRGKLDVPKETFRLYPECGPEGQPMVGWAGWDWLQQAQSLVVLYQKRKDENGWSTEQLTPILVALFEVVPWVKQWYDDDEHDHAGSQYETFLNDELRQQSRTTDDLRAWRPTVRSRGRKKSTRAKKAGAKGRKTPKDTDPSKAGGA